MSLENIYGPSDLRGLKLRTIVERLGKKILLLSAMSCCEPTMNQIALACSENKLKRKHPLAGQVKRGNKGIHPQEESVRLDATQTKKAKEASKTQNWNSFDVSFLNKILSLIDVDESDFLKTQIREIKDKRNDVLHNDPFSDQAEFDREIEVLKKLFSEALGEAETIGKKLLNTVSSQDKKDKKDEIQEALKEIQSLNQNIRAEVDKIRYAKIDEILNHAEEYIQGLGQKDINAAYKKLIYMNPLSFLIGKNESYRVTNFYVQPEFSLKEDGPCISLDNILDKVEDNDKNLLIEGPSGVGKTTFTRVLMAKKQSGERFQDVFIIPFECRNRELTSVKDVISDMMPNASKRFTEDKLFQAVLSLKPLFLIDGVDERNEESNQVIKKIISLVNKGEARFVATTRPDRHFLHNLQGHKYESFELTGIAKGNLENIVDKYYSVFSTTQHDVADQDRVKNGVLKMCGHFKDQIKVPLILCIITYLLVNKDKSIDQCQTLTAIYKRIFECIFKKLETRLMDKDERNFNERTFRQAIKKFKCHLNKISLQTLKNDQISLTEDTSDSLVEDCNDAFGKEALSSVFSCKGFDTVAGVELTPYTYPHRSFQDFLAANQISLMLQSKEIQNLKDALKDTHLRNKSLIFFIAGILESENKLSKNLCEEIAALQLSEVLSSFDNKNISAILRETMETTLMSEAISSQIEILYIDDAHFDWWINSILKGPCPKLKLVKVNISSKSDTTDATMSLLREKDVPVELRFTSEKTPAELGIEDLLGKLLGGRCNLTEFEGRLGERGLKMLTQKLRMEVILQVETVDEVEGIKWLSGRNLVPHDHSQGTLKWVTGNDFVILKLTILNECDVDLLPDCLPIPSYSLDIVIQNERDNSLERIQKVVRKLPSNEYRLNLSNKPELMSLRLEWSSATHTDLDNLCNTMKAEGIFVNKFQSDSSCLCDDEWDDLDGRVENVSEEDPRFFSSREIARLPSESESLTLYITDSVEIGGLHLLKERLSGGNMSNGLQPMKIKDDLTLVISPICDPKLLPERFPTGDQCLHVVLLEVDGEKDFAWMLDIIDRLPRYQEINMTMVEIDMYKSVLSFEQWEDLFSRFVDNNIEALVTNEFECRSQGQIIALRNYEKYDVYIDNERLSDSSKDSIERRLKRDKTGEKCDDLRGRVQTCKKTLVFLSQTVSEETPGMGSSREIARLPSESESLTLYIFGYVEIGGLQLLKERLSGGNMSNGLQPMKIKDTLTLYIWPSCDQKLLPERFPTGDQCLEVYLMEVDGEKDFAWMLDIIDRLPRYQEINMIMVKMYIWNTIDLSFGQWDILFQRFLDNHIEAFVYCLCLSQEKLIALLDYKKYDVFIHNKELSRSTMDSIKRRLKRDKTGEKCARTGLPWP